MEGAKVVEAADRFKKRGEQQGESTPSALARVYYLDDYREARNEIIEDIVKQSSDNIVLFLVSNGEYKAAEEILEVAYDIASEDIPPYEVRLVLEQHFSQIRPNTYRIYKIMNR